MGEQSDLSAVARRAKAEARPPFSIAIEEGWRARRKRAFAHLRFAGRGTTSTLDDGGKSGGILRGPILRRGSHAALFMDK